MATLNAFVFLSLNGFYKGPEEDITWHTHGEEETAFSLNSLKTGNTLLLGRTTYDMMYRYWTSETAHATYPEVAAWMNKVQKVVVSSSLHAASWTPSTLIQSHAMERIRQLKQTSPKNLTVLGSGHLLCQLAEAGLVDTFQVMIDPVFIPNGKPLLVQIQQRVNLQHIHTRVFKRGSILLEYKPVE